MNSHPPTRLSKRVAEIAQCSRHEAELLIEEGCVRVDGVCIQTPQHRVTQETIWIDPQARTQSSTPVTLLWHRPDTQTPCTVASLPRTNPEQPSSPVSPSPRHFVRQQTAAPLPDPLSGLVVFTQERHIWQKLQQPRTPLEHEVMVECAGSVTPEHIAALNQALGQLAHQISGAHAKASLNSHQPHHSRLRFALKGLDITQAPALCQSIGLVVTQATRTRLGRISIAGLQAGQWRYLHPSERF